MQVIKAGGGAVEKVVEALKEGRVIVVPTDTVYGLLADAGNEEAVKRVFEIKQRLISKPLYVFVKDMAMAKQFAHISEEQEEYLKTVWPGRITAVLEGKHLLPEGIEHDGKIGMRIPDHLLIQEILEKFQRPVTGTSANIAGQPSCRSAEQVKARFAGQERQPDIVVDGRELPFSSPSTVVDITDMQNKKIIRQ